MFSETLVKHLKHKSEHTKNIAYNSWTHLGTAQRAKVEKVSSRQCELLILLFTFIFSNSRYCTRYFWDMITSSEKKKGGTRINQHHLISAWTFLASTCVLRLNKNFNQMMKTNSGLHGFPPSSFKGCPVYSSKLDDVQSACAKNITGSCEWFQRAYQTELETALLPPCHYHFLILRSALISPDAE